MPSKIAVVIDDKTKEYGEADDTLSYSVFRVEIDENNNITYLSEIEISGLALSRTEGEEVGTYTISYIGQNELSNYTILSVENGTYTITKATISAELDDKTVLYSGSNVEIDKLEIDGINDDEITYVYSNKYTGEVVSEIIGAGTYEVYAEFSGNDYFNAFKTNVATLKITKKLIPITLRTLVFVYDGTSKLPEYDVNLSEAVNLVIEFEFGEYPVEIGTYNFTITANEDNYYCEIKGVLEIVAAYSNSNSNTEISATSVNFAGSNVELVEVSGSSLSSMFSSSSNGLKCVSVYSFKNIEGLETSDDVLTVSIKANTKKNAELYIVDAKGNATQVSYDLVDGYYVFNVSDLTCSILVAVKDNSAFLTKTVLLTIILFTTFFAVRQIRTKKKNKFFNKNTKHGKFSTDDAETGLNLVESAVVSDEDIKIEDLLN